jgi:copper(I)-binding protein
MRVPLSAVLAATVAVVGLAGLWRGSVDPGGSAEADTSTPIVVTGAYVREPASTEVAAAYLTVRNNQSVTDTLASVTTGAGLSAVVHTDDSMTTAATLVLKAGQSRTLSVGNGHVMIEGLYGTLKPGDTVSIELNFKVAGPVLVTAPVIAIGAPAPTGAK